MTTVRPDDWDDPVRLPEVSNAFARILVPFDGSHAGEEALAYAARLSDRTGGEIIVVVAFDPPMTMRRRASLVVQDARSDMEAEASGLASEAVARLADRGRTARAVVTRGEVVDGILQVIEDEDADIVIMGRRGLNAEVREQRPVLGRLQVAMQGSVADKVARHAAVPVLLVG